MSDTNYVLNEMKLSIDALIESQRVAHCQPSIQVLIVNNDRGEIDITHDVITGWVHYGDDYPSTLLLAEWHGHYHLDGSLDKLSRPYGMSVVLYNIDRDRALCNGKWISLNDLTIKAREVIERNGHARCVAEESIKEKA